MKCEKCGRRIVDGEYGISPEGKTLCYDCGAEWAREDLLSHGNGVMYLTGVEFMGRDWGMSEDNRKYIFGYVGDWTGRFKVRATGHVGRHNLSGIRRDVWFKVEGREFHGVQYGDNSELCYCKAVKS